MLIKQKTPYLRFLLSVAIFFIGLVYGFLAYRLTLPPYETLMKTYQQLLEIKNDGFNKSRRLKFQELIVDQHSSIKDNQSALQVRRNINQVLWGKENLPLTGKLDIKQNISGTRYKGYTNLESVDEFTITLQFGINSVMHFFKPEISNGRLVIYHQGHGGDFLLGSNTIKTLVKSKFSVLAVAMPLKGLNSKPSVNIPALGRVKLTYHNQLQWLELSSGSPLKLFVEPLVVAVNHLTRVGKFNSIDMVGLSGGGWTTTLYAAIDDRIRYSFSVAGSEPLVYSAKLPTEYEQIAPELYRIAGYIDLYILSSIGPERAHYQIYNKYDPCCYQGKYSNYFERPILERAKSIGNGLFDVIIDSSHAEHKISDFGLNFILSNIE